MPSTQLRECSGGQTIENIANGVLGNANTSYTYMNVGEDNWRSFSMIYTITATTVTIEASNDPASVADASKTWFDISTDLLGASSVTATGSKKVIDLPYARLRFKRVTSNATNAFKLDICKFN